MSARQLEIRSDTSVVITRGTMAMDTIAVDPLEYSNVCDKKTRNAVGEKEQDVDHSINGPNES